MSSLPQLIQQQQQAHIIVNENFRALSEQLTIALVSDADYNIDTDLDYHLYLSLKFTDPSVLLTQDRNVILPNTDPGKTEKPYFFVNSTAHGLTLKVSGQTGVLVQPGESALLYCNGTDIERLIDLSGLAGNQDQIGSGESVYVASDRQLWIFDSMEVDGNLTVDGRVRVE